MPRIFLFVINMKKISQFTLVLLIGLLFLTPVQAETNNSDIIRELQQVFRNFDGVVLCNHSNDASSCVKFNQDDVDNNLGDGGRIPNGETTLVASSKPVRIYLSSSRGGSGPKLAYRHANDNSVSCEYNFIQSGDEEDPNPDLSENLPCSQGLRGGNGMIATTFRVSDIGRLVNPGEEKNTDTIKTVHAVYLERLCVIDDNYDPNHPERQNCANTWNDAVSAYSILGLENTGQADPGGIPITLGLTEGLTNLYKWALSLVGITALGFLMFAGVKYAASAGNPSRISDAKDRITRAIVGLALLLVAPLLLTLISPNFTRINDIILESNPSPGAPGVVALSGGGNGDYTECIAKSLENVGPTYGPCVIDGKRFYSDVLPSRAGNFGDPYCERALGQTEFLGMLRLEVLRQLSSYPCLTSSERLELVGTMVDGVISCESPGFNPNATLFKGDRPGGPEKQVPQCTGAWGLFQMGKSRPPGLGSLTEPDAGDVPWREQVEYAIEKLMQDGGEGYWECWKFGERPGTGSCERSCEDECKLVSVEQRTMCLKLCQNN